jgi:polyisoprenoid-binding protein YceI
MKVALTIAIFSLLAGLAAERVSAAQRFDFKDPKGVNNITFRLDAPLEAISGSTAGVSGEVEFDPANPGALKGRLVVATETLHVPNPMMKQHLHSDKWLDVAKHPEISFRVAKVASVKTVETETKAEITGDLSIKGVTKSLTVPVRLTYLKDKLSARLPNMQGDLLVLRASFTIKRSDFGINPGQAEEKVSDEIELKLSLAGQCPK